MPTSVETSATFGELNRGVGVSFKGLQKGKKKGKMKKKRVGYLAYE